MNNFEDNSIFENISFESNEESSTSIDTNKKIYKKLVKNIIYWFRGFIIN